jgi:hypothetical protein
MTKLEAWKAWCDTTGTGDRLANQFTLDNSSHGKAFSFAWDAATETCAMVCDEFESDADPDARELLERCENEMRYAGWTKFESDNPARNGVYEDVKEFLK